MEMLLRIVFGTTVALAPTCAYAADDFFPPEYAILSYQCPEDGSAETRPIPFLSDFEQQWFSKHLRAAEEPSLFELSKNPHRSDSLRFTWLRSFHAPVIVRLTKGVGGNWRIMAKELSGAGGYDPGKVKRKIDRELSVDEAAAVTALLTRSALPDQSGDCVIGVDGAQWIIERVDRDGYHFINRWSPSGGPVREIGEFLLNLTGWRHKPVY